MRDIGLFRRFVPSAALRPRQPAGWDALRVRITEDYRVQQLLMDVALGVSPPR